MIGEYVMVVSGGFDVLVCANEGQRYLQKFQIYLLKQILSSASCFKICGTKNKCFIVIFSLYIEIVLVKTQIV